MSSILEQMAKLEIPVTSQNIQRALAENQANDATTRQLLDLLRCAEPVITDSRNTVTITTDTVNASIKYSVDGGEPRLCYSTPFTVGESCVVKALAEFEGRIPSYVSSKDVEYVDPVANADFKFVINSTSDNTLSIGQYDAIRNYLANYYIDGVDVRTTGYYHFTEGVHTVGINFNDSLNVNDAIFTDVNNFAFYKLINVNNGSSVYSPINQILSIVINSDKFTTAPAVMRKCYNCTSVKLNNNTTTIPNYCLYDMPELVELVLPSTLTTVDGGSAFVFLNKLETVTFGGTMAQWNSISMTTTGLSGKTIHCTDGDITVE